MLSKKNKLFKLSIFLFLMFFTVFSNGIFFQTTYITSVQATEFKPGDIISYFDAQAVNVTYTIAPSTTAKITPNTVNSIYSLKNVLVRSSTYPYSILQNDNSGSLPIMHNGNQQFLRAYYQVAHLTGEYRLDKINQMLKIQDQPTLLQQNFKISSSTNIASVQKALSLMSTVNDTASSSGFVGSGHQKLSVEDLRGKTDINLNISDSSITTFSANLDPSYQQYASYFSGNTSETDFVKPSAVNDQKNSNILVSGFSNLEKEGFLSTLKANIAANMSTASTPIVSDQVTILDYTAWNANLTNFETQAFRTKIQNTLTSSSTTVATSINFFGLFQIQGKPMIVPGNALIVDPLSLINRVFTIGKVTTSTPLPVIPQRAVPPQSLSDCPNKDDYVFIKDSRGTAECLAKQPVASINYGLPIVKSALTTAEPVTKGGTQYSSSVTTNLIDNGSTTMDNAGTKTNIANTDTGKFSTNNLHTTNISPRSITDFLKENVGWIALFSGAGLLAVIVVYFKFVKAPAREDNYPKRPF